MKQILVVLPVIFSLFMLNSCVNENLDNDVSGDKTIRFQIKVLDIESGAVEGQDTRLNVEEAVFEDGDEIGLFAVKRDMKIAPSDGDLNATNNFIHNAKLTYDSYSKSWVSDPPLYYPENRTAVSIDFYAYYPYRESVNPNGELMDPNRMDISGGVLTNQEGRSALGKSDFMTASKRYYKFDEGEVELVFKHHFSLVRFKIPVSKREFNSIAIFTPEYSVQKFNLISVAIESEKMIYDPISENEDLTYNEVYDSGANKKIAIGMHLQKEENSVATYEALVIPQTIEIKNEAPLFYCFDDRKEKERFFYIYLKSLIDSEKQILDKGKAYTFIYK
jgi:hypothetical protein